MILVGLTGGLATGKSTVAAMLRRCGATVIDADALAREVVAPGSAGWRAVVRTFGAAILGADKTIDRATLGRVVFRSANKRRRLEKIIHPRVARQQARLTRQAARANPQAVVVYDVPLLFEAGIDARVNRVVVVTADRKTQIARLAARNGFTGAEAIRRIRSQMPLRQKVKRADYVLDGTLPRRRLFGDVRRLYRLLKQQA
ncbi:MAG: dephospho-CoA kinase [Nitrospiraceae bacterium]|nr:dephospho-CoA kinase [Nitrospiraceae bacterium]